QRRVLDGVRGVDQSSRLVGRDLYDQVPGQRVELAGRVLVVQFEPDNKREHSTGTFRRRAPGRRVRPPYREIPSRWATSAVQAGALEDLVDRVARAVQRQPDEVELLARHRPYGGPVVPVVAGAEELLGED